MNVLVDAIIDKKGSDIMLLDVQGQCIFADYFLLCCGDNERQLRALAQNVVEEAKSEAGFRPIHQVEGRDEDGWLLVDFGHVIVHVFSPEMRQYYNLEELWQEAHTVMRMP